MVNLALGKIDHFDHHFNKMDDASLGSGQKGLQIWLPQIFPSLPL